MNFILEKYGLKFHFIFAFFLRIAFTLFGIYVDYLSENSLQGDNKKISPKYTDIDYQVFTDAARHVYEGDSPYDRATYRYTPILAIILQPNIFFHESFGKCLFVLFDLLCGYLIIKINNLNKSLHSSNMISILFWFYNPITIAISSRGNAESLMAFLVLIFIYFLKRKNYLLAGFLYAVSIHFKIYPVVYGIAILLFITKFHTYNIFRLVFNKNVLIFGITFLLTFIGITSVFYLKYGWDFLFEAYLYHLSREDIRHNFSPFFYLLYLTNESWKNSMLLKIFYFMPQIVSILLVSTSMYQHIELCFLVLTVLFVSFNKVCTSQYFVWYLCLIPIVLPKLKLNFMKSLVLFMLWMFGQGLWLYFAFELEFNGKNTFFELWIAGLIFLIINCGILKYGFLDNYQFQKKIITKKTN